MSEEALAATIARLRRQCTDDASVEVKSSASSLTKDVWDSVSAFANTHGGMIILGLAETDDFSPVPQFAIDRVRDQFVSGIGDGGDDGRLTHPPAYEMSREAFDGSPVLVIRIQENRPGSKPCFVSAKGVNGGSFKRVDDKDIALSATEIFELHNVLTASDADFTTVDDSSAADLDSALVAEMLAQQSDSRALRGTSTAEERLMRLNATKKSGNASMTGLLVLGQYPQQFFPRLYIDVTAHPTNEKSSPAAEMRFLDRVRCDGPLIEAVENAVAAVQKNLRTHTVVVGTRRTNRLEIPVEVLREAIANAVVHREYSPMFLGQSVSADIYPDRVVVTNPGGLWGGKTIDNIDDGTSRCRNPKLMQLLQLSSRQGELGYPVEGQGSGVRLMINEMEAVAQNRPRFVDGGDQFQVILARHGAEIPEHREWLHDLVDRDLTPQEDAALVIAKRSGNVSASRLRSDLHIDSDDARAMLAKLEREGVLRRNGQDLYELAEGSPLLSGAEAEVFRALSAQTPMSIHEISEHTRRSPNTLRPLMRRLVAKGWVEATAPPSSRLRRYLALQDPQGA